MHANMTVAIDSLEANIFSETDLGRLINTYIREEQIDISTAGMETYTATINYKLEELHIYGSSRSGIHKPDTQYCSFDVDHYFNPYDSTWKPLSYTAQCTTGVGAASYTEHTRIRGKRFYELSNHLGNVLMTITDRKLPIGDTTGGIDTVLYFVADISTVNDYYPFGMLQPERSYSLGEYRFGFNGQEKDDEISGTGNSYTAEFWQYDPRLGRRWNVDPVVKEWESPYACFVDSPILLRDINGADTIKINHVDGEIIEHIKTDEGKDYFILMNKDTQEEINFLALPENTIIDIQVTNRQEKIVKNGKEETINFIMDVYELRGDGVSQILFEWLSVNTGSEYALTVCGQAGISELNFITTSHTKMAELGVKILANEKLVYGYTIRKMIHAHPYNPFPSGLYTRDSDIGAARAIQEAYDKLYPERKQKIIFQIYHKPTYEYIDYDGDSEPEDFGRPPRKK